MTLGPNVGADLRAEVFEWGDRLCHNDFHPDNIIFRTPEEGGPVIIDWERAGVGDPIADVAGTRWMAMITWLNRTQSVCD